MPIVEDVRGYAQTASTQGKAALTQVNAVLHTASERISTVVEDAPRPEHLALGAAEVGVEALGKYAEAAARKARARVAQRQSDAAAARTAARKLIETYFENAKGAYATVSARGEARAAALSTDDLITKLRDELSAAPGSVRSRLEPALQSLLSTTIEAVSAQSAKAAAARPGAAKASATPPASKPPVKTAPARKAPAKRTPANKAPAKAAAAKAAPAKKAAARKPASS